MMKKDIRIFVATFLLICLTTCFTQSQARNLNADELSQLSSKLTRTTAPQVPDTNTILKCFSGLVDSSCVPEIFQSISSRKISVSPGCCKAILELDEECVSNAFETVPFFYPLLKQHCSTHLTQKSIPYSSPSSSSSSTSTQPSSKNLALKQDPPSNPSTSSPVQSASPPNTPSSGNQTSLPFELKPVQLPLVYGGDEGCWQGSGNNYRCWGSKENNISGVCCNLVRFRGKDCSTGREYDNINERCCMQFNDGSHNKCIEVTPYYS
ncbi:hypothetical protein ACB092_01G361900 [Castanea dentata]